VNHANGRIQDIAGVDATVTVDIQRQVRRTHAPTGSGGHHQQQRLPGRSIGQTAYDPAHRVKVRLALAADPAADGSIADAGQFGQLLDRHHAAVNQLLQWTGEHGQSPQQATV
jgi:hypothetical protein